MFIELAVFSWDSIGFKIQFKNMNFSESAYTAIVASFLSLPCFCSSVCNDCNTWNQKSGENGEGLGAFVTWVMGIRWTQGRRRGWGPIANSAGSRSVHCPYQLDLSTSLLVETLDAVDNSARLCILTWPFVPSACHAPWHQHASNCTLSKYSHWFCQVLEFGLQLLSWDLRTTEDY